MSPFQATQGLFNSPIVLHYRSFFSAMPTLASWMGRAVGRANSYKRPRAPEMDKFMYVTVCYVRVIGYILALCGDNEK